MNIEREFKGHSGASVYLYKSNDRSFFVRKQSGTVSRNERLKAQAEKQSAAFDQGIHCPRVLRTGYNADLFFFDMNYMPGTTLSHVIANAPGGLSHSDLIEYICNILNQYQSKQIGIITPEDILDKINRIHNECKNNDELTSIYDLFDDLMRKLKSYKWPSLPATSCHGDMTLENIVYHPDSGFGLIDFDVVDQSSAFLDLCKVMQDCAGKWCLRSLHSDSDARMSLMNATVALDRLEDKIYLLAKEIFPNLCKHIYAYTAFHLIRTVPYSQNQAEAMYAITYAHDLIDRRL